MSRRRNPERDDEIVQRYKAGATQHELSLAYHLTRGRIQQILATYGVTRRDNPNAPRGDLSEYVGVYVTPKAKDFLRRRASTEQKSISSVANTMIESQIADQVPAAATDDAPKGAK